MSLQERKQILKGEMNEKIAGGEKNDFDHRRLEMKENLDKLILKSWNG